MFDMTLKPYASASSGTAACPRRGGFTLVEMLVVIAVIAILAAMGFPAYLFFKRQVDIGATTSLVNAVASAISIYGQKTWSWQTGTSPNTQDHVAFLWDLNRSFASPTATPDASAAAIDPWAQKMKILPTKYRLIDGAPNTDSASANYGKLEETHDGNFDKEILDAGYTGFYNMCQPSISKKFVNKRKQVVDAWGQPLRIAFAANTYGASWFGVWSPGPDKKDDDDTTNLHKDASKPAVATYDDITSWKNSNAN